MRDENLALPAKIEAVRNGKSVIKLIDASDSEALEQFVLESDPRTDRKAAIAAYFLRRQEDPSLTDREIAAELGLKVNSLQSYKSRAISEGWFRYTDPTDRLENEALPKAVETLIGHIEARNLDAALALLRGMGHLKNFQAVQPRDAVSQPSLSISIDIPTAIQPSSNITAAPKVIDVEPEKVSQS